MSLRLKSKVMVASKNRRKKKYHIDRKFINLNFFIELCEKKNDKNGKIDNFK